MDVDVDVDVDIDIIISPDFNSVQFSWVDTERLLYLTLLMIDCPFLIPHSSALLWLLDIFLLRHFPLFDMLMAIILSSWINMWKCRQALINLVSTTAPWRSSRTRPLLPRGGRIVGPLDLFVPLTTTTTTTTAQLLHPLGYVFSSLPRQESSPCWKQCNLVACVKNLILWTLLTPIHRNSHSNLARKKALFLLDFSVCRLVDAVYSFPTPPPLGV